MKDPDKKTIAWKAETLVERFNRCRAMLAIHGFLSQAESDRVYVRLSKWVAKHKQP